MSMPQFQALSLSRAASAVALVLVLAAPAAAGPPLLCDRFEPGPGAVLLPWGDATRGWNTPDDSYDTRRLIPDTLRLLSADAPVLARMENLRRAALYAARDRNLAAELLATVLARTEAPHGSTRARALASFDAGYLIETYRQAHQVLKWRMLNGTLQDAWAFDADPAQDGYPMVQRALALAGSDPVIEYAASLMTSGAVSSEHRRRALAAGNSDRVLAWHLAR